MFRIHYCFILIIIRVHVAVSMLHMLIVVSGQESEQHRPAARVPGEPPAGDHHRSSCEDGRYGSRRVPLR